MQVLVQQLKKKYDFDFLVNQDILEDEEDITAQWESPLKVEGHITLIDATNAQIQFCLSGEVTYPCSRCLDPVKMEIDFQFDEVIEGVGRGRIDLSEYILDCLYINEPFQVLCKENCKGLCPHCGMNLNKGTCNCLEEENVVNLVDPRLEKLKDLLLEEEEDGSSEKENF